MGTTNGFIFQVINSLIESCGVRLTWFDCNNSQSYIEFARKQEISRNILAIFFCSWSTTPFPLDSKLKQLSQTRKGFEDWEGRRNFLVEQLLQTTPPHFLQWCCRIINQLMSFWEIEFSVLIFFFKKLNVWLKMWHLQEKIVLWEDMSLLALNSLYKNRL